MVKSRIHYIGNKYGRLLVIKQVEDKIDKQGIHWSNWLCQCDCGNTCEVIGHNLASGNTNSCGCYNKERIKETQVKTNEFDLSGDYGIGYTSNNEPFYFSLEDYNLIKDYCWCKNSQGYIVAPLRNNRTKFIFMHRLVMNVLDDKLYDVDHINHNLNDSRRNNLRVVSRTQNNMNRNIQSNNTSGITGVGFDKRSNKWIARITVNKKTLQLGAFINKEDAIHARKDGELKYFGEYTIKDEHRKN